VEALVVCLVAITIWMVISIKKKKRDQAAAKALIAQIKDQSRTRLQKTELFLAEKYRLEGNELHKAVESIDKAEKKFMQNMINIYLQRDAQRLTSMDALIAEMIDTYKSYTPVVPDTGQEVAELKEINEKLTDELRVTKENMTSMASEFGNMFGGGKDTKLDEEEVVEKVIVRGKTPQSDEKDIDTDDIEIDTVETSETPVLQEDVETALGVDKQKAETEKKKSVPEQELDDEDVDELLNSIDLSDTK
jgi:hypothetical protein